MGLAQIQEMLGSLYTDPDVRARFTTEPVSVGQAFGLSGDEVNECNLLSAEQLSFFARSLIRKRLTSVKALLPRISNALGSQIDERFDEYRTSVGGPLLHSSAAEAHAFTDYLVQYTSGVNFASPYFVDLVKLDRSELAMHRPGRRFAAESIRAPLEALENGRNVRPWHTLVIWIRVTPEAHVHRFSVSLPW